MKKGVRYSRLCLFAFVGWLFQTQVFAQTVSSVAIDFQILTEIRPVAYQPGTLLYESGSFSLQNKYNTVTIHGLGIDLPNGTSEVTWSIEFLNLGVGRAGLLLYDPPTLGDSHDDFWEKVNGQWEIKSTKDGSNFAARLAGVPLGKQQEKVIYENAKTSLGKLYLSSKEIGDTVILDGDNSELTAIQFEYYAALSPFGDIPKGKVRLYLNDGESHSTAEVPVDPRGEMTFTKGSSIVFDNPRGVKGDIEIAGSEIGDEFKFDDSRRVINQIQFEYYAALNPFESDQKGVLRFYANNGSVTGDAGFKKPGDLLFESPPFSLRAGYNMVTVSGLRVHVPEDVPSVTWAFDFTGLTSIGKVGLLRHDSPVKGDSANAFWINKGTKASPNWQLQSSAAGRGNFSARVAAQIPLPASLSIGSQVYKMGSPIEVSFSNGPGNPKDWIGIYRPEAIPGSTAASAWAYVNGSKISGEGHIDGKVEFKDLLAPGNYVARLFGNDGYEQLSDVTFSIAEPPELSMGSENYLQGQPITIQFANGPGNAKDWIAVYRPDAIPSKTPSLLWAFVNGTQTASGGQDAGSITLEAGLPAGEYIARFLENDGYTQLAEVSFYVTDNTMPVITLIGLPNIKIPVGGDYTDAGATAVDDVDGKITSSIQVTGGVNVNKPGVYTISFNVKDTSGNAAATVNRTITVADVVPPVITLIGSKIITIPVGSNYTDAGATANDDVDGEVTSFIEAKGEVNINKPGIYNISFNVKDSSGNIAETVLRTIRVVDVIPPVIKLVGSMSITITVGGDYTDAGATAIDDVDGDVTFSIQSSGEVNTNKKGVYKIAFNVKDSSGNAAETIVRKIIVEDVLDDMIPPVISLKGLPSVTIPMGANYTDAGATAHDNLDGNISSLIQVSGIILTGKPGTYTITYNVKDSSGNSAKKVIRTITVEDKTSPVITLNGAEAVTIQFGDAYEDAGATASDSVDGDITSYIETKGIVDVNQPGVYTIFFNVKDNSGNVAVPVVRTVTVVDAVPPVITLNGSPSVTIQLGDTYIDAGATAWDNADGDISNLIEVAGIVPTGSPGVFTRTFKVQDKSGNPAEPLVRIIRVIESGPPALQIARNADGNFTIKFEGQLQTTSSMNVLWRTISLESPVVLSPDQAAAFFRAKH